MILIMIIFIYEVYSLHSQYISYIIDNKLINRIKSVNPPLQSVNQSVNPLHCKSVNQCKPPFTLLNSLKHRTVLHFWQKCKLYTVNLHIKNLKHE
jgi:hypothetical protein